MLNRTLSFIRISQAFKVLGTPLDADRAVIDVGAALAHSGDTKIILGYSGTLGAYPNDNGFHLMGSFEFRRTNLKRLP